MASRNLIRPHTQYSILTPSSFWEARFLRDFLVKDGYACVGECPPDANGNLRHGQSTWKLDPADGSVSYPPVLLVVESEYQDTESYDAQSAESLALERSKMARQKSARPSKVYSMTT